MALEDEAGDCTMRMILGLADTLRRWSPSLAASTNHFGCVSPSWCAA